MAGKQFLAKSAIQLQVPKRVENFIEIALPFLSRAATILRLLRNKTIQFNTRGKKIEPAIRKPLT